jgi:hypothetical protein
MDKLNKTALEQILRGRPGLIIGSGTTVAPRTLAGIAERIREAFVLDPTESQGSYLDAAEVALASGAAERQIKDVVKGVVAGHTPAPILSTLVQVPWNAVFSSALDPHLEHKMTQAATERLRHHPVTVTALETALPPRSVPVFKLLGDVARDDAIVTRAEYITRKTTWRYAVPQFSSLVRGGPVLCIGMSDAEWVLHDLLAELIHNNTSAPANLIFLADDPMAINSRRLEALLLRSRTKLHIADLGLSDLTQTLSYIDTPPQRSVPSARLDGSTPDYTIFEKYADIVVIVNQQMTPRASAEERTLLLDLLFSPPVPRWDPYVHNLHFPRTLTRTICEQINSTAIESPDDDAACVITGEAASGKTMLLKEIAFTLARSDSLVLWHKHSFSPDSGRQLRALFDDIVKSPRTKGKRVFYCFDDPVTSRDLSLESVAAAARAAGLPITLIVSLRTSDWATTDLKSTAIGLGRYNYHHLSDTFDDDEWKRLPQFLVDLGIYPNHATASSECERLDLKRSRDTLSTLYLLLPHTRSSIEASIRGEYLNLGDLAGFRRVIIGTHEHSTQFLQDAFSMVAVADFHGIPLPVEVLVSALNTDYETWLDAAHSGEPAWGFLYGIDLEDGGAYYGTRNEFVTEVLLEVINGSIQNHGGEFSVLLQLINACAGRATPVYREFCERVLVPSDRPQLRKLSCKEGTQLYDAALAALTHPDRSIKHHRGLWIKNQCRNATAALAALEDALHTPSYPYTHRGEAPEHIHNSIAATLIDAINRGEMTLEEGREQIFEHLSQARSAVFFNSRAAHVHANAALMILPKIVDVSRVDTLRVLGNALADIDMSIMVLENPISHRARDITSIQALNEARDRLFGAVSNIPDLREEAATAWDDYKSQDGFIVEAAKLLSVARASNRRKHFSRAYDYCLQARRQIEAANLPVSTRLAEIQLQTYWTWRVDRHVMSASEERIQWEVIKDLVIDVLRGAHMQKNPLYSFMAAVAAAHLGDWVSANRVFSELRNSSLPNYEVWRPRALLLHEGGGKRQVQGTIRENVDRKFFYAEELKQDFQCDKRNRWNDDGEIDFAYIQFAFGGARAVIDVDYDVGAHR